MVTRPCLVWNDENVAHIARHGVTPEDVEYLCAHEAYVERAGKGYFIYRGQNRSGRYLMAVLDDLGNGVYYVVTARPLTRTERSTLLRKWRRKE